MLNFLTLFGNKENKIKELGKVVTFVTFERCSHGKNPHRLSGAFSTPRNQGSVTLKKESWTPPESFAFGEGQLKPLRSGEALAWKLDTNRRA